MFLVIEIQKTGNQLSHIVTTHETQNEAESKFYTVLSYAAVSELDLHAATILREDGRCIRTGCYEHLDE